MSGSNYPNVSTLAVPHVIVRRALAGAWELVAGSMAAMRVMSPNPHEAWRIDARGGVAQALVVPHPKSWAAVLLINGRFRHYADFALKEEAEAAARSWRGLCEVVMLAVEDAPTI